MKVIMNVATNFGGTSFKPGDITDVSSDIGQRWITRGLAHLPKEEIKPIDNIPEEVVSRESKILETESEFEPLPEVTEENKSKLKTNKPKKKKITK
jgi:hypothetical protein